MDHLDELRVATASSLPLNGLAPAPTQSEHAHVRGPLQSTRPHCGLLVDRLSSSRIPASRARPFWLNNGFHPAGYGVLRFIDGRATGQPGIHQKSASGN
jgi:hypothetical protein